MTVLLLTGCADGSSPPSEERVPGADYIARADRICGVARAEAEAEAVFFPGILKLNLSVVAGYLDATVSIFKTREAQLSRLEPPRGDEARVDAILEEGQRQIELAREAARVAKTGNVPQTRVALRQLELSRVRLLALRADYGFQECARGAVREEKAEYLARGDEVCAEMFRRLAAVPLPSADGRGAARYATLVADVLRESVRDLDNLDVPADDEGAVRQIFIELGAALAALERAAAAPDEATAERELNEASKALVGGQQIIDTSLGYRGALLFARNYGFRDCGGTLREPLDIK